MPAAQSDAMVFFGVTGDLAFKKIFPALQQLAQLGRLDNDGDADGKDNNRGPAC